MKQRCENPNHPSYPDYGGRGIFVCDEWRKDFSAFIRDMGERPNGFEIDRRDVNGPYSKENCRWITHADQQKNRRDNIVVEMNGKIMILADWCRELGLNYATVSRRINKQGMSPKEALCRKVIKKKLSNDVVELIRKTSGKQSEIAKRFNVDQSTVSLIKSNNIYKEKHRG